MLLWVLTRILTFLDSGVRGGKSNTVTTRHVTASQNWVEKQLLATAAFWSKESVKGVIQNFWQKKKGHIFFISKIFHITSTLCLVKPSLWTSASPYFDSVCSRQCRRHLDTHSLLILIIMINNIFHRASASSIGVKDSSTLTPRAVTLVHPKSFLGNSL